MLLILVIGYYSVTREVGKADGHAVRMRRCRDLRFLVKNPNCLFVGIDKCQIDVKLTAVMKETG